MKKEKIIQKSITINSACSNVWNIIAKPENIKKWMSDSEIEVISDWRAGSRITYTGEFNGHRFEDYGTILKLEPYKVFRYGYWSRLSKLPDAPENYTIIEFHLVAAENKTTLHLHQHHFPGKASYEHWNFYWMATLNIIKDMAESME